MKLVRRQNYFHTNAVRHAFGSHKGPSELLPSNRNERAGITLISEKTSIFANVKRGITREVCQDTLILYRSDSLTVLGIFDGLGPAGHEWSELMGRGVLQICAENEGQIARRLNGREIIIQVANDVRSVLGKEHDSGTTATLAVLEKGMRYSIAAVGDSPAFIREGNTVSRVFRNGLVFVDVSKKKPHGPRILAIDVKKAKINFLDYSTMRQQIEHGITRTEWHLGPVEMRNGRLARGGSIIIMSDGISNNLKLGTDGEGNVQTTDGCKDLQEITTGESYADDIGEKIAAEARKRTVSFSWPAFRPLVAKDHVICAEDDDQSVAVVTYSG